MTERFESDLALVLVSHNDPRGAVDAASNRSFRVQIDHTSDEHDSVHSVDDILIKGSVDDVIALLEALGVNLMERTFTVSLSTLADLRVSKVPFSVEDATRHLMTDPTALACFASHVTKTEMLERLRRWQSGRNEQ
jgi:hypothetical protein